MLAARERAQFLGRRAQMHDGYMAAVRNKILVDLLYFGLTF